MPVDPLAASIALSRYFEVAHLAHRLSVSQEFVRRLIRDGELVAIRVGVRYRIHQTEVDRYLERCEQAAKKAGSRPAEIFAHPRASDTA